MAAQRQDLAIVNNELKLWDEPTALQQIRTIFAPKLSPMEWLMFVELGRTTGLNPYLREIWAVKYDDKSACIFIGRDGYRKAAQRQPSYDYHRADAVYSKDKFLVSDGVVSHQYSLADRGELLGAYCVVQRKGSSAPSFVYVELKEYSTGKSLWRKAEAQGKPATMIKKVAEAQALKATFQEVFAGTYHEYEDWRDDTPQPAAPKPGKGMNGLRAALDIPEEKTEYEVVESSIELLYRLITEKKLSEKTVDLWKKKAKIERLEDMPEALKQQCINYLKTKE